MKGPAAINMRGRCFYSKRHHCMDLQQILHDKPLPVLGVLEVAMVKPKPKAQDFKHIVWP